jgi:two-component system response regulator
MKNRIILLVEDNPDDVRLTQRSLKANGIMNELVVVNDGAAALEYLERAAAAPEKVLPAVTLLDLNLPKISGLELLRKIRSSPPLKRLPVVVLTSSKEEKDLVQSYDLGANSYIQKPVEFDEFNVAVRQLGLYWLLLNEPPPPLK